jgi:nitroreductase
MTAITSNALAVKPAVTKNNVNPLLRKRWSARSFSDQPISTTMLEQLFEAASWAPSSMNEQPWRYAYALKGSESYDALLDCLQPGNAHWAQNAAVLVISMADTRFKNFPDTNRHALHDTGAANALLLLEAAANDIYGHEIGGYKREETRALLDLPAYMEDVCFIALGYLDEAEKLDEPFRTRELSARSRKQVDQFTQAL